MTELENGVKVTYSIKELLTEISRDIKDLSIKVDTKAEKSVVDILMTQVNNQNVRISNIEQSKKDRTRLEDLWVPVIVSFIVGLILAATTVIAAFPHGVR